MRIRTPSQLDFQLDQKFFGLDTSYQIHLHEQLFELIWYGEGRWDWNTVYHLPLHIKRLWIKKINEITESANTDQRDAEKRVDEIAKLPKINM